MRKEVNISEDIVKRLQEIADKKKWSLKKTMEEILIEKVNKRKKYQSPT